MYQLSMQIFSALVLTLTTYAVIADSNQLYLEENGIILFEVEDQTPSEGWEYASTIPGHEGEGYYQWVGPDRFPKEEAGEGTISYDFRVQTAGNYQVRWRSYISIGENSTEHNDSWIRFSSGENVENEHPLSGWTKVYMNTLDNWSWTSKTVDHVGNPIRQYFSEGDHRVEISGRSRGHAIDRIALYRYADVNFSVLSADNWDLSKKVTANGERVDEEEVHTDTRANLEELNDTWSEHITGECVDNTLALSATAISTFDPTSINDISFQTQDTTLISANSSALISFDLSLVPPATATYLQYSTNNSTSNGTIIHSLASLAEWNSNHVELISQPYALVELSRASGGWLSEKRYQSLIPSTMLQNSVNTILITSIEGSEPLIINSQLVDNLVPRIIFSGNETFCSDWQSNLSSTTVNAQTPNENLNESLSVDDNDSSIVEELTILSFEEQTLENTNNNNNDQNSTTAGGGFSSLLLSLFVIVRVKYFSNK